MEEAKITYRLQINTFIKLIVSYVGSIRATEEHNSYLRTAATTQLDCPIYYY